MGNCFSLHYSSSFLFTLNCVSRPTPFSHCCPGDSLSHPVLLPARPGSTRTAPFCSAGTRSRGGCTPAARSGPTAAISPRVFRRRRRLCLSPQRNAAPFPFPSCLRATAPPGPCPRLLTARRPRGPAPNGRAVTTAAATPMGRGRDRPRPEQRVLC